MKAAQFWRINANMVLTKISSVPNNIVVKMNVACFKKDFKFLYTWENCKQIVQDLSYDYDKTMEAISTVRSICIEAMYIPTKHRS